MPNTELSEVYFVAGMMALLIIISAVSTYLFVRQYKKEKNSTESRSKTKENSETDDR